MLIQCQILKTLIDDSIEKPAIKSILHGLVDRMVNEATDKDQKMDVLKKLHFDKPHIVLSTDSLIIFTLDWIEGTYFGVTFKDEHRGKWVRISQFTETFDEILLIYLQHKYFKTDRLTLVDLFSKQMNPSRDDKIEDAFKS